MGDFLLDTTSNDAYDPITLFPEWEYRETEVALRAQNRSINGVLRTYDWENYFSFNIPLRFVDSADTNRIKDWWRNSAELFFTIDNSLDATTIKGKLMNPSVPLGNRIRPYNDLFQGTLIIEATNANSYIRQPFVLDHSVLGKLDQTYNELV